MIPDGHLNDMWKDSTAKQEAAQSNFNSYWYWPWKAPHCPHCNPRRCPCCGRILPAEPIPYTITWTNDNGGHLATTCSHG